MCSGCCEAITEEIRGQLDEVVSLDHDRILRSYLAVIDATLRTNYYNKGGPGGWVPPKGGPGGWVPPEETAGGSGGSSPRASTGPLVLKLDPGTVPGLTSPRPKFE